MTATKTVRCSTCDTELTLGSPGYLQVRTEGPEGELTELPRYFCSRACLYETAHYAPHIYNAIRSATHKGGRGRV
jgi:hypothetical protein